MPVFTLQFLHSIPKMQKTKINFMNSLSAQGVLSVFIPKPKNSKKRMNSLSSTGSLSEFIAIPKMEACEPQLLKPPNKLSSLRLSLEL